MKELSIEQKAKAYDEALKKIRILQKIIGDATLGNIVLKNEFENIFPELKESEDEKMREMAIKAVYAPQAQSCIKSWGINPDDVIAWLKKQQNPTLPKWKYKNDNTPLLRDSLILNKYGLVAKSPSGALVSDVWVIDYDDLAKLPKEEIEKQGEQNPNDKAIKPKFKVGDWITNGKFIVGQIISVGKEYYHYICNGIEQPLYIPNAHKYHLWTIQDAKEGDIIFSNDGHGSDSIEIIRSISDKRIDFWFCLSSKNNFKDCYCDVFDGIIPYTNFASREGATPATKEQRDLLFQKMKEAGYDWDSRTNKMIHNND